MTQTQGSWIVTGLRNPTNEEWKSHIEGSNSPAVISNAIDHWRAIQRWDLAYFQRRWGNEKVLAIHQVEGEHRFDRSKPCPATLGKVIESLGGPAKTNRGLFLSQFPFLEALPGIGEDVGELYDLLGRAPVLRSLWLAAENSVTHLHWDSHPVLVALIKGTKRFRLFSPREPSLFYPVDESELRNNWSRVDFLDPDAQSFPDYLKQPYLDVELRAGQVLYIPQYWWHCAESLSLAMAVQFMLQSMAHPESWAAFYRQRQAVRAIRRPLNPRIPAADSTV